MTTKIHLLNELIELNNDRAAGFYKAIRTINDDMDNEDLKELFEEFATQSKHFSEALTQIVSANEGEPETGNSVTGSLHRAWIDIKSIFGGSDRESVLSEAERGEDIIKNAYRSVIQQNRLAGIARDMVSSQSVILDKSHDKIKQLRDSAR